MKRSIDWASHLKAQEKSGLSAREYCRNVGISDSSFSGWRRKLSVTPGRFVEIPAAKPESIEIKLRRGITITVTDNVSPSKIKSLIETLSDGAE